jgi:transposase
MRRQYPSEFRTEAVQLVASSGRSMRSLAAELGITAQTLRNGVRQAAIVTGRQPGLTTSEREELQRLRRENRLLREEREILTKATAFFARENQ